MPKEKVQEAQAELTAAQAADEYDAAELAANARKLFGYSQDIAAAALAYNHVTRATRAGAKKIITQFAERKVN